MVQANKCAESLQNVVEKLNAAGSSDEAGFCDILRSIRLQFFVVIDFARTAACSSSACCVSSSSAARLDLIEGRWCSMHV